MSSVPPGSELQEDTDTCMQRDVTLITPATGAGLAAAALVLLMMASSQVGPAHSQPVLTRAAAQSHDGTALGSSLSSKAPDPGRGGGQAQAGAGGTTSNKGQPSGTASMRNTPTRPMISRYLPMNSLTRYLRPTLNLTEPQQNSLLKATTLN